MENKFEKSHLSEKLKEFWKTLSLTIEETKLSKGIRKIERKLNVSQKSLIDIICSIENVIIKTVIFINKNIFV